MLKLNGIEYEAQSFGCSLLDSSYIGSGCCCCCSLQAGSQSGRLADGQTFELCAVKSLFVNKLKPKQVGVVLVLVLTLVLSPSLSTSSYHVMVVYFGLKIQCTRNVKFKKHKTLYPSSLSPSFILLHLAIRHPLFYMNLIIISSISNQYDTK